MKNITGQEWIRRTHNNEKAYILDVRTSEECATGIIHNAKTCNFFETETFDKFLETLDKDKEYFVYCRSGNRSGKACKKMDEKGFNTIFNLIGGMNEWTGAVKKDVINLI